MAHTLARVAICFDGRGPRNLRRAHAPKRLQLVELDLLLSAFRWREGRKSFHRFLDRVNGHLGCLWFASNPGVFYARSRLSTVRLIQGPLGAKCKALGVATHGRMLTDRFMENWAAMLTVRSWPQAAL